MTEVAPAGLQAMEGEGHKPDDIEPARNRNGDKEQVDAASREKEDIGKDHSANSTGGAIGAVFMVAMHVQGQQVPAQHRPEIEQQKMQVSDPHFHRASKQVQAEQVEQQVLPMGVQKGGGYLAVILLFSQDAPRLEDILLLERAAPKAHKGNQEVEQQQSRGTRCQDQVNGVDLSNRKTGVKRIPDSISVFTFARSGTPGMAPGGLAR
jgi:hypothetical protein